MTTLLKRLYILILLFTVCGIEINAKGGDTSTPRIVNVINFIRQTEPRIDAITDKVLYETVAEQVKLLNHYNIKGTYLLQYDALISPSYQNLLKNETFPGTEIGGWWEITQPHVEAAGLKWRGRYPWDWHADVGFATGYTPEEREKLVDVYMEKFKEIFGKYPTAIGCWFIDAHTLAYMYDKYHIVASCNCRDQIGTDGYTMWGGYWGQGYYPSRRNAYMPAQTKNGQIQVPVFRMLGSDPIYQYDLGIGGNYQGVVTLEPVYGGAGGSKPWVEWFFNSMFKDPCMTFSYTQAGQENSFTWGAMKKGLEIQIPLLSELQKNDVIRVETLSETGKWYKDNFSTTPPTAISALTDYKGNDKKTVWYNSKYYRANLLWEGSSFRFRDIHLFNEKYASDYIDKPCTSSTCVYTTLPFVDGNMWSSDHKMAGLRLFYTNENGQMVEAKGGAPKISHKGERLLVEWPLDMPNSSFMMAFDEDKVRMKCITGNHSDFKWYLELSVVPGTKLPFTDICSSYINSKEKAFGYKISCKGGTFVDCKDSSGRIFRIEPNGKEMSLLFKN